MCRGGGGGGGDDDDREGGENKGEVGGGGGGGGGRWRMQAGLPFLIFFFYNVYVSLSLVRYV